MLFFIVFVACVCLRVCIFNAMCCPCSVINGSISEKIKANI